MARRSSSARAKAPSWPQPRAAFVVGFQADEIDVERRSGWSVLGVGEAYEILDPARLSELADRLPTPWAPDRTGHCISIPLQRLTGRWLSPAG